MDQKEFVEKIEQGHIDDVMAYVLSIRGDISEPKNLERIVSWIAKGMFASEQMPRWERFLRKLFESTDLVKHDIVYLVMDCIFLYGKKLKKYPEGSLYDIENKSTAAMSVAAGRGGRENRPSAPAANRPAPR